MTEDVGSDEADLAAELGFEPAVPVTGAEARIRTGARGGSARKPRRRMALRRRLGAFAILVGALSSMGGAYAVFAYSSGAADSGSSAASIAQGRQLYQVSCITCHGANLQGVQGQGPAIASAGGAAVYFQVTSGRMPLAQQGAQGARKTPMFNEEQTRALAAYVQSVAGGPGIPAGNLRGDSASIAEGGELFRYNCAQCHGVTGHGAPNSAGKMVPSLANASDLQIYTAMLTGPENMPVFSENELTPAQKKSIIAYVQMLRDSADPGGNGLARIGPVSEGVVLWVAGIGALMAVILWIGAKSQ